MDYVYNLGGSEAIAETYFKVLESQRKDNQDPSTIDMRTFLSFVLPDPSKCPIAIEEISKIYRNGRNDLHNKVKRHRSNIFTDSRNRAQNKYKVSKSVDTFRNQQSNISYIN